MGLLPKPCALAIQHQKDIRGSPSGTLGLDTWVPLTMVMQHAQHQKQVPAGAVTGKAADGAGHDDEYVLSG